jgi:sensor histidine kinase YesM
VLSASQRAKHSLATEIDLCRAYLDVERARFGDRLQVSLDIPPGVPTDAIQIPVLTLQPLVENAVRHGVAPRSSGGWVRVGARENGGDVELTIADDGVGFGRSPAKGGSGTGLANCRERLRLHYGDRGNLRIDTPQGGGTRVTVTFPAVSA